MKRIIIPLLMLLLVACTSASPTSQTITPTTVVITSTNPGADLPLVEGAEPSLKMAAFYYPWYGNPKFDKAWIHWD